MLYSIYYHITVCTLFWRIFEDVKVRFSRKHHDFPLVYTDPRVSVKHHEFPLLFNGIPWAPVADLLAPTGVTEGLSDFALPAVVRRTMRKVFEMANTAANGDLSATSVKLIYRIRHNSVETVIWGIYPL